MQPRWSQLALRRQRQCQTFVQLLREARETGARRFVRQETRGHRQRGQQSSVGESYAGESEERSNRESKIKYSQQTFLKNQRVKAGHLGFKEKFDRAQKREYDADNQPRLMAPGGEVKPGKHDRSHQKDQAHGARARYSALFPELGKLQFRETARQQDSGKAGKAGHDHHEPDVISTQKFLLPSQTGCAARVCFRSAPYCLVLPEARAAPWSFFAASGLWCGQ